MEISAQGRMSTFIEELFPDADTTEFKGTLTIRTDQGQVAVIALELGGAGELTALPVSPIE